VGFLAVLFVRVRVSVLRAYTQNYSPNSSPLDGSNLDARTKVPTHTQITYATTNDG
jgi:hypothetical protein